jgi:D-aminopeptidase
MMAGLDASYAAAIFIGYHAKAGRAERVLAANTFSGRANFISNLHRFLLLDTLAPRVRMTIQAAPQYT